MIRKRFDSLLLSIIGTMSVWSGLEGIGKWIDKVTTMCLVIVILLLLVFVLWLLSKLFGGGARG
jgi:choline-glycine betaine transporter